METSAQMQARRITSPFTVISCRPVGLPATDATVYDTVRLSMTVRVPTNAQGFKYDFRFWTYEYPIYICTQYNDFFLALLTSEHPEIPSG